jgi:putative transposase
MAQGLVRYHNSGDFHFVTFSYYQRQPHLRSPDARSLFERSLETIRRRYSFYVFGYVVMTGRGMVNGHGRSRRL